MRISDWSSDVCSSDLIELIAVVQPVVGQVRELARKRRDQFQAILLIGRVMPLRAAVHPEMLEARRPMILAGQPEAVEIAGADIIPVVEQYAQLEGRLRRAHEIGLVDAEQTRSEEHKSELQS